MSRRVIVVAFTCIILAALAFSVTRLVRTQTVAPEPSSALAQWLTLSPQQRQQIERLDPQYHRDAAALAQQLHHERRLLADMLEAGAATDMDILEQVERIIAAHNALERRVAEHLVTMRRELEPEQRRQLGRFAAGQVRRGMGRRAAEGEGPGAGPRHQRPHRDHDGAIDDRPRHGRAEARDGRDDRPGRAREGSIRHTIDLLFEHHDRIDRQVEDLPDGVLTTTTSADEKIADALRRHVRQMKQQLAVGRAMRRGDPLFRELFAHRARIQMEIEDVPGGVRVRHTSEDPEVVLLIRQHAHAAVSQFIEQGPQREHRHTPLPPGYPRR